jgi:hypothetical protein
MGNQPDKQTVLQSLGRVQGIQQQEEIVKHSRMIMFLKTTLLAAMIAQIFILPAYGQQDVDPTSYPWSVPPKPAAKPAPKKITEHKDAGAANAAHKDHASATQVKKKQVPAQQPLRTAEALPPEK